MPKDASYEVERGEITFLPEEIKCGNVEITRNSIVIDGVQQKWVTGFRITGDVHGPTRLTIEHIIDERITKTKQGDDDA